jgi:hypothetical protein
VGGSLVVGEVGLEVFGVVCVEVLGEMACGASWVVFSASAVVMSSTLLAAALLL